MDGWMDVGSWFDDDSTLLTRILYTTQATDIFFGPQNFSRFRTVAPSRWLDCLCFVCGLLSRNHHNIVVFFPITKPNLECVYMLDHYTRIYIYATVSFIFSLEFKIFNEFDKVANFVYGYFTTNRQNRICIRNS